MKTFANFEENKYKKEQIYNDFRRQKITEDELFSKIAAIDNKNKKGRLFLFFSEVILQTHSHYL